MIKPEFFDDTDIGDLSLGARLFFIGLWTQADRDGRLQDDAKRLKARLFPYDDVNVEAFIEELHVKDMVRRYQDGAGNRLIWVKRFAKHQRPHHKESESVIAECGVDDGRHPGKVGACPGKARLSPLDSGSLILESGVRSLEKGSTPHASVLPSVAFLDFPVIGPGQSSWTLSEAQVAEWVSLFPGLDVRGESSKALAWLQANQGRRKTGRGMARFLVSWLSRAVDSDRGRRQGPSAVAMVGSTPFEWVCTHTPKHAGRNDCHVQQQIEKARAS